MHQHKENQKTKVNKTKQHNLWLKSPPAAALQRALHSSDCGGDVEGKPGGKLLTFTPFFSPWMEKGPRIVEEWWKLKLPFPNRQSIFGGIMSTVKEQRTVYILHVFFRVQTRSWNRREVSLMWETSSKQQLKNGQLHGVASRAEQLSQGTHGVSMFHVSFWQVLPFRCGWTHG